MHRPDGEDSPTEAPDTPSDEPTRELEMVGWPPAGPPSPWGPAPDGFGYRQAGRVADAHDPGGGWPAPPGSSGGDGVWGPAGPWAGAPQPYRPPPPPRPRHTGLWLALVAALVAFATVSGIGIRRWANGSGSSAPPPQVTPNSTSPPTAPTTTLPALSVPAVSAKLTPALVDVDALLGYEKAEAAGTGIVLTSDGAVLTNNHVIEGATEIRVTDLGNHNVYTATVAGYDRTDDVAVLQLTGASGLTTATIGDSSKLAVGQEIVGMGNAGGEGGAPTAASGRVTALNQNVSASDESDGTVENLTGLIQTDANIQAGDSGGPLANAAGQVVGVDTAGSGGFSFRSSGHEGFAIPINRAMSIARQIQASQASASVHIGPTAFLGVKVTSVTGGAGSSGTGGSGTGGSGTGSSGTGTGQPGPSGPGAHVSGVVAGTPAAAAGLADGDVITSLGGHRVSSSTDLSNLLAGYHPGDTVSVTWVDAAGHPHSATVTLAVGPAA